MSLWRGRTWTKRRSLLAALVAGLVLASFDSGAEKRFITLASTTSTENSGLFDELLPKFEAKTGIAVRVVAIGTGQALRLARNGDADVLLVHHRPSEKAFVAEGYGVGRRDVMYNDFVIIGPKDDPAKVRGAKSAAGAMKKIAAIEVPFASRGDDSGTHKKEVDLWRTAGVFSASFRESWYLALGSGMGATLNAAAAMKAYTLSDRATWTVFKNKADLTILFEGDKALFNPYGVILVNPKRHPHVKAADAQAFIDWLTGPEGQGAIANFKVDGRQLFFPNAGGKL